MNTNTVQNNNQVPYFKFVVSYRNNVLSERIFKASWYNKDVRNSVNIKNIVPEIRKNLQKVLSSPNNRLTFKYYAGRNINDIDVFYDLNTYLKEEKNPRFAYQTNKHKNNGFYLRNVSKETLENILNKDTKYSFCVSLKSGKVLYLSSADCKITDEGILNNKIVHDYNDIKAIDIAEELTFKFGLFINNNYIIEREFTVYSFNPEASHSMEFMNLIEDIITNIKGVVYRADVVYQNEEYEASLKHFIPYNDVHKMSYEEKQKLYRSEPNFENYKFDNEI